MAQPFLLFPLRRFCNAGISVVCFFERLAYEQARKQSHRRDGLGGRDLRRKKIAMICCTSSPSSLGLVFWPGRTWCVFHIFKRIARSAGDKRKNVQGIFLDSRIAIVHQTEEPRRIRPRGLDHGDSSSAIKFLAPLAEVRSRTALKTRVAPEDSGQKNANMLETTFTCRLLDEFLSLEKFFVTCVTSSQPTRLRILLAVRVGELHFPPEIIHFLLQATLVLDIHQLPQPVGGL